MEESNLNNTSYKLILKREKNIVGCAIGFNIYIDGAKVVKIKNGETVCLNISAGNHEIAVHSKRNGKVINIDGDKIANVVVFGPNDFGISNVKNFTEGDIGDIDDSKIDNTEIDKYNSHSKGVLFGAFCAPLFTAFSYPLSLAYCPVVIGFAIINISTAKKLKAGYNELYKTILIRNVIAIILACITFIVSMSKAI